MNTELLISLLLSFLPISEIRVGLPLGIHFAITNNFSIPIVFILSILSNILGVLAAFWFFDNAHSRLLKINGYKKYFGWLHKKYIKKAEAFEKKFDIAGFAALAVFVAVPLPLTGAWSGAFIAWILELNRKKSIASISLGILGAGLLVLAATLGVIGLKNIFS